MSDLKVSKIIWDKVSVLDKQHITSHLRLFGVIDPDQNIIADDQTELPCIDYPLDQITTAHGLDFKAQGIDWLCRDICNLAKIKRGCSAYGPTLATCLATIADSRELHKNQAK